MIEVENLTKKYGDHIAVDHLSFRIDRGMIYGFLGPNGAGKSTTMNIMTGYIAATEGTVKINGYDILKEPEMAKKSIGYLPEIPPVYLDMTVWEYLKFVAELKKVPKAERNAQIEEIMRQTRVDDVKDRLIKNLSKGYKQRVGLAQAMIGYPEVIILDEPTVGLDPKQIIEIRELIKELAKKHTVILSSHILSEVSAVCDHIMIISKGKLVASDTPEGLMTMMKGGKQLTLCVKGEEGKLDSVLKEYEQIKEYHFNAAKNEGCVNVTLNTESDEDIREELFYRLASEKLPIMELSLAEKTLEDVFLELTEEEQNDVPEDAEKENDMKENEIEENKTESMEEDKENESDI